jgi:transcriptional regulator with XRE-family HTH domain
MTKALAPPSAPPETLGQFIRRKRSEKKKGLREMAREIDISPTYLSRVETDEEVTPPAEDTLKAIAKALGENPDFLMHLAKRVPSDVQDMIAGDRDLPKFLRTAHSKGFTGSDLISTLLNAGKPKRRE